MPQDQAQILQCGICGKPFSCEHEMSNTFRGIQLAVPHCFKCGWDNNKCPHPHGYMCSACQQIGGPALQNRP